MTTTAALTASPGCTGIGPTRTRWVVAFALVIAGVAHGLAVAGHHDSAAAVSFFVGAALVQLVLAVAYVQRPTNRLRLVVVGATTVLLVTWAVSRTVGIAIGHAHGPEALGVLDAAAVAAEVVALLALASAPRLGRWRPLTLTVTVALSVAVAGTAVWAGSRPAMDHPAAVPGASAAAHEHGTCHAPECEPHAHP